MCRDLLRSTLTGRGELLLNGAPAIQHRSLLLGCDRSSDTAGASGDASLVVTQELAVDRAKLALELWPRRCDSRRFLLATADGLACMDVQLLSGKLSYGRLAGCRPLCTPIAERVGRMQHRHFRADGGADGAAA